MTENHDAATEITPGVVESSDNSAANVEPIDRRRRRTKEELLAALADFEAEAILSLVRPGRLGEWKQRLFELRVAFEEADRGR